MLETCINIISSLTRSFNLFMLKESGVTLKKLLDFKKKKFTTPKPLSVMFSFALFSSYITARNFKKLVGIMDTM